jgi:hypothetical protein
VLHQKQTRTINPTQLDFVNLAASTTSPPRPQICILFHKLPSKSSTLCSSSTRTTNRQMHEGVRPNNLAQVERKRTESLLESFSEQECSKFSCRRYATNSNMRAAKIGQEGMGHLRLGAIETGNRVLIGCKSKHRVANTRTTKSQDAFRLRRDALVRRMENRKQILLLWSLTCWY